MSEAIPTGWELVSLKEGVSKLISGQSPNRKQNPARGKAYGILKTTAVDWGKFDETHNQEVLDDFVPNTRHLVKKGDVLITKAGPEHRVGVVALVKEVRGNMLVSGKMTSIRVNNNIRPNYLSYALCHEHAQKHLKASTTGMASSQTNFTHEALLDTPVLLPPLNEQLKIAEILTSVDEVIENTQSQITKLEDLKKATMNELLTKGIGHTEFKETEIGRIPKSWMTSTLQKLVTRKITYGIVQPGQYDSSGVLLIRGTDYMNGWKSIDTFFRVSSALNDSYSRSQVQPGDLLISIAGYVGTCAIVPSWIPSANITQTTARIRCSSTIDSRFLMGFIESDNGKLQIRKYSKGSAQEGLNLEDIEKFLIPVPPPDEQNKITKILHSNDRSIVSMKSKLFGYRNIKKSLMQDLLTGKVRVTVN